MMYNKPVIHHFIILLPLQSKKAILEKESTCDCHTLVNNS